MRPPAVPPADVAPDDPAWFNTDAHHAAARTVDEAISRALHAPFNVRARDRDGHEHVAHVTPLDSPAGGGKTYAVTQGVATAARDRHRILVVSPTNEQVEALAIRIHRRLAADGLHDRRVTLLHKSSGWSGSEPLRRYADRTSLELTSELRLAAGADIVIATIAKVSDLHGRGNDLGERHTPFALAIVDESYQAACMPYAAVVNICPRGLTVGDPGQLRPFSSDPNGTQYRGHSEDPLLSASAMIMRRHGTSVAPLRLPITRRLPASAMSVVRHFYPDHPFDAWTRHGTRIVDMSVGLLDREALLVREALAAGWAHVLLPPRTTQPADPEVGAALARLIAAAMGAHLRVASETTGGQWREVETGRVAVLVSTHDQEDRVNEALDDLLPAGSERPTIGTANALQGLEFDLTFVWYPMAGQPEFDGFYGDPARLAVMLTRHRHGCVIVGRASDADLFDDALPPLGAWDGADNDDVTTGWLTHQAVLEELRPFQRLLIDS